MPVTWPPISCCCRDATRGTVDSILLLWFNSTVIGLIAIWLPPLLVRALT